ncbi:MAG: hypothetical protein JNL18_08845 [Planctomycetaceae bacterium]|nr:hypothetical protein [Planctomycetaceae bacterium]
MVVLSVVLAAAHQPAGPMVIFAHHAALKGMVVTEVLGAAASPTRLALHAVGAKKTPESERALPDVLMHHVSECTAGD